MNQIQTLRFDAKFLFATDDQGHVIHFTKTESALLCALAANSGQVISRSRLLDTVFGDETDVSERNIDFLINRVRRKLQDPPKEPLYIATQYGEGYWWVPKLARTTVSSSAFIVIGPVRGLSDLSEGTTKSRAFLEELRLRLDKLTTPGTMITLDPDGPSFPEYSAASPRYAISIDFLTHENDLECAVTTQEFLGRHVVHAARHYISQPTVCHYAVSVPKLAEQILAAIWDREHTPLQTSAPTDVPLPIRMHLASKQFSSDQSWQAGQIKLRARLKESPQDHEACVMLASSIHTKYVMSGPELYLGPDNRFADENEIEGLIMRALPHIQTNQSLVLAAAKLLYFVDRGHESLAVELAERTLREATALATVYAVVAQIRAFEGDISSALQLYDKCLPLCEPKSLFADYVHALRCQAALVSGSVEIYDAARADFATENRASLDYLSFALVPRTNTEEYQTLSDRINALEDSQISALLNFAFYTSIRLFKQEEHRTNFLRGPAKLLLHSRNVDIVPPEIVAGAPGAFAHVGDGNKGK